MPDHSEISKLDLFLAGHSFQIDGRIYRIDPDGLSAKTGNSIHYIQQSSVINNEFNYFGLVEDIDETGFTWSRKFFGTFAKIRVTFDTAEFISQQAETPVNA